MSTLGSSGLLRFSPTHRCGGKDDAAGEKKASRALEAYIRLLQDMPVSAKPCRANMRCPRLTGPSKRKIKCDGLRPCCQKCLRSDITCEGYSSWEVAFRDNHNDKALVRTTAESQPEATIPAEAVHRAQMLAAFIQDRYPAHQESLGPYAPHTNESSLLHVCARVDINSPPLLLQAIDTICLAHLAGRSQESRTIYAASLSRGRLLATLRSAVLAYQPSRPLPIRGPRAPPSNAQSIMMAIVLMSITPSLPGESTQRQSTVHLQGMLQFLIKYGPSFLTGHPEVDTALIRQLQIQGNVLGIARRRSVEYQNPEWARVPRVFMQEDQAIYRETGYLASDNVTTSRWRQPTSVAAPSTVDRNLVRDLIVPTPKLLESADNFSKGHGPHSKRALDAMSSEIRRAHDVQAFSVEPSFRDAERLSHGPAVNCLNIDEFDTNIEEHVYLFIAPTIITEHYRFTSPKYSYPSMALRFASILTDCAILQVIRCGVERDGLAPDWAGVDGKEVERRARRIALQICQHVHYKSQRATLTAARFLRAYITAAKNLFESAEAEEELEWCKGCLVATSARITRLAMASNASSICPMTETYELMAEGCRYVRRGF